MPAVSLFTFIRTISILAEDNLHFLPEIENWSNYYIDIENFHFKKYCIFLFKILDCCKKLAGVAYKNSSLSHEDKSCSAYNSALPTVLCITPKNL